MTDIPEFSHMQSPEAIVRSAVEIALRKQSAELAAYPDLGRYVHGLANFYDAAQPKLLQEVMQSAELVEPEDSILGVDPEYSAANSFMLGSVLGANLAETLLAEDFERLQEVLKAMNMQMKQPGATAAESAHTIMDYGGQGLGRTEAAKDLLEIAEDSVCSEVRQHIFFRHGFGYVMFTATELKIGIEKLKQKEVLQNLIEHAESEGDWDEALKGIV